MRRAAHAADCGAPGSLPHVPVRQWVLSLPIPLRLLLAAQPKLVTPVLQVVHRVITRFLLQQSGLRAEQAEGGAVTLIQRFGSAANLNLHLHRLGLDGVYRRSDVEPDFVEVPAPRDEALQAQRHKIIGRLMKLLTRRGVLVEEEGSSYLADSDADSGQRARAMQRCRAGGAQAQDALARRHHTHRDVAAGVHAAPGGAGTPAPVAPDPIPRGAGAERLAAGDGGASGPRRAHQHVGAGRYRASLRTP